MTMITNIQHFLDENGEIPTLTPEAEELLNFLGKVVEAATIDYGRPLSFADTKCRKPNHECSSNEIEVWVDPESNQIGWECLECGDDGFISDWEQTKWDMRTYQKH